MRDATRQSYRARESAWAAALVMLLPVGCATMPETAPATAGAGAVEVRTAAGAVLPAPIVARNDGEIVGLLQETNRGEIEAGSLAEQRSLHPEVKSYARRMVEEHRALEERGGAGAAQLGITPALGDSVLPRRQQAALNALRQSPADRFDQLYLDQEVNAHRRTLALIDAAMIGGQREELKVLLLNEVRPRVVEHLEMAEALRNRVSMR